MMGDMGGFGWGMGAFGWVFMILFWGLIIVGIVALVKWAATSTSAGSHEKTPKEILQTRYARGEIDQEEYEQKKRDLQG